MKNEKSLLIILAIGLCILTFAIVGIIVVTGQSNAKTSSTMAALTKDIMESSNSNSSTKANINTSSDSSLPVVSEDDIVKELMEQIKQEEKKAFTNEKEEVVNTVANTIVIKEDKTFGVAREHSQTAKVVVEKKEKVQIPAVATQTTTKQVAAKLKTEEVKKVETSLVDEYWVQIASFSKLANAKAIQEELEEQGYTCLLSTIESDGNTMFRVRIGPYYSKEESNKAVEFFKKDKRFNQPYVIAPIKVEKIK